MYLTAWFVLGFTWVGFDDCILLVGFGSYVWICGFEFYMAWVGRVGMLVFLGCIVAINWCTTF